MTAVKVQPSVKTSIDTAKRAVSDQPSVRRDDFTKLLQTKKDGTQQTKKADTETRTDKKDTAKTDEKSSDSIQEDSKGQEVTAEEDGSEEELSASQEALQQAALQQAAAQLLIQPEGAEETVPEIQASAESSIAAVSTENVPETVPEAAVQTEAAGQVQQDTKPTVKTAEPEKEQPGTEAVAEQPVQKEEPQKVVQPQERSDSGNQKHAETKTEAKAETLTAAPSDRKVSQEQETDSQYGIRNSIYGAENQPSQQVQEPAHVSSRTEQIPMKTTPEQLPQDLGKTLASRTLEAGRTLTVELEPANLGKLTIKLVYEGERASLSIMASNPRTLDLLSQKASEIAAILEEKTGQETIIYTQPAEQGNEQYDEEQNQNRGKEQGEPEDRRQGHGEETHQAESFAQQLRLGLV